MATAWAQFPVLVLTGARQVGKTTLARHFLPQADYVSLDTQFEGDRARFTPDEFLANHSRPLIIDEVQYAPTLFPEIKRRVDADRRPGQFLLTGSQRFELMANVTESLAGRCAILQLPPLGLSELARRDPPPALDDFLWLGGFPEFWKAPTRRLHKHRWFESYVTTYLERDVRALHNIGNLRDFSRLLRALALRAGQMLSYSDLARDVGISPNTAKSWVSALEAGQQIFLLEPYHVQRSKRLVKTPKIYFYDTGLLTYMMGFNNPDELPNNALYGALWENLVVAEIYKHFLSTGRRPPLYYWRTSSGHEIDLLVETAPQTFIAIECKGASRVAASDCAHLKTFREEYGPESVRKTYIVCRTDHAYPLAPDGTLEAVPLAGESGLLSRAASKAAAPRRGRRQR